MVFSEVHIVRKVSTPNTSPRNSSKHGRDAIEKIHINTAFGYEAFEISQTVLPGRGIWLNPRIGKEKSGESHGRAVPQTKTLWQRSRHATNHNAHKNTAKLESRGPSRGLNHFESYLILLPICKIRWAAFLTRWRLIPQPNLCVQAPRFTVCNKRQVL